LEVKTHCMPQKTIAGTLLGAGFNYGNYGDYGDYGN
jgi:hypothetical protein